MSFEIPELQPEETRDSNEPADVLEREQVALQENITAVTEQLERVDPEQLPAEKRASISDRLREVMLYVAMAGGFAGTGSATYEIMTKRYITDYHDALATCIAMLGGLGSTLVAAQLLDTLQSRGWFEKKEV